MKIHFLLIGLILMLISGCSSEKQIQPDSPQNTSLLLNHSLFFNDYDKFISLYSDPRKQYISEEFFKTLVQIKKDSNGGVLYENYELLTFDSGEMILVKLINNANGQVEIEDILTLPEELRDFFKDSR